MNIISDLLSQRTLMKTKINAEAKATNRNAAEEPAASIVALASNS